MSTEKKLQFRPIKYTHIHNVYLGNECLIGQIWWDSYQQQYALEDMLIEHLQEIIKYMQDLNSKGDFTNES